MTDEQTPYPSNENPSTGDRSYDVSPSSAYGPVRSGSPIPGDSVPDLGMPAGQPQVQPARQTTVTPASYTPVGPQQGYGQQQAGQDAYAYQQAQAQRQAQMRAAQAQQAQATQAQATQAQAAQAQQARVQAAQAQQAQAQQVQAQQARAYQQGQTAQHARVQQPPQPQASTRAQEPSYPQTTTVRKAAPSGLKSALFGLAGGAVGALVVSLAVQGFSALGATPRATTTSSSAPTASSQSAEPNSTFSITANSDDVTVAQAVAAKALPSVVSVYVTTAESAGMGSGVILDTEGNILTNYHVAGDADTISVTIAGKSYDATFVGGDASSDLAVVKADLQGDSVTPMEIGDSDALTVGDWVMTIGSPFGLDQSVSAGIVSSLSRNSMMQSTYGTTLYTNLIQTDASINPGNSGGALVNAQGQLVGISTLFSSDTESFAGIGFAIPGNYAIEIANKIIAGEQVTHAYIGLSMQTVNAQAAEYYKLPVNQGAYVAEVAAGGPAEAAGIQVGDVVTKIGKDDIMSADGVILAIRSHHIGETVDVTVMRGNEEMTFQVTLGSDEELQALQQQQREEQQQQYEQQYQYPYGEEYDDGYGNGNGYGDRDVLEEVFEYLYNNRGGSYELSE